MTTNAVQAVDDDSAVFGYWDWVVCQAEADGVDLNMLTQEVR